MSTLVSVKPYDEISDGRKHYRTLLQCTARPGLIGQLDDAVLDVPPDLNRATAMIVLALFTADTSFYLDKGGEAAATFVQRQTGAKPLPADHADFLILPDANRLAETGEVRLEASLFQRRARPSWLRSKPSPRLPCRVASGSD